MSLVEELVNLATSKYAIVVSVLVYLVYKWIVKNNNFFADRGIKYKPPTLFFGNFRKIATQSVTLHEFVLDVYGTFPAEKLVGIFELRNPILMLRDPETIKRVGVKDFDHFVDHRTAIDEESDALFGRGLFTLKGSKWRDMRATLSPAFTGSKMRTMFQLVIQCAEQTKEHLLEETKRQSPLVLEMKDLFSRFANDVIATSAFGIGVNSFENPQNEFFEMGKDVSNFEGVRSLIFFGFTNFPRLMKFLKITLFPKATSNFFRRLVIDSMKYRDEHNVHRPDMINLLMEARKGQLIHEREEKKGDGFSVVEESEVGQLTHKRGNWRILNHILTQSKYKISPITHLFPLQNNYKRLITKSIEYNFSMGG